MAMATRGLTVTSQRVLCDCWGMRHPVVPVEARKGAPRLLAISGAAPRVLRTITGQGWARGSVEDGVFAQLG